MTIGINWDEEDARYTPAKVERSIVQENKVDAIGDGTVAPSVLQDTVPASAVGQASVPPPVSTASSTGSPLPVPPPSAAPSWVNNAATSGGNALKSLGPIVDPRHYDQSGQLDQASTAAHAAADAAVGYSVLKTIQGVGSGISRRISNVIGGVDPTIQAQINQSDKQAARAASAPQGRIPNPIATPMGRIEPTMAPEAPPPPPAPAAPAAPETPVQKAAVAVSEPTPYEQERHRLAKIKADKAEFEFERMKQKGTTTSIPSAVIPEAGRTLEQTAALGKTLSPNAPVITPLPVEATPVTQNVTQTPVAKTVETPVLQKTAPAQTAPVQTPPATPEITGEVGTAVKPKLTRTTGQALIDKNAQLAQIANNPPEVAGQPGMREQYGPFDKKQINPTTGKPFIGAGGYNYLASQVGHEVAPEAWKALYGEQNVSHKQVQADYSEARKLEGIPQGTKGGAFGTPKYIPKYIKGAINPSVFAEGAQKIAASPFGQGVASTVKGGAAMLPFALATDVKQQNVGYRRELEQEMKKTQNPERQIQLQSEIQKLDDDLYIKAMQRRFIDNNIPSALRK